MTMSLSIVLQARYARCVALLTIAIDCAFPVMLSQAAASFFSVESAVAASVQDMLRKRLQHSPTLQSYIREPYKVKFPIHSSEALSECNGC